MKATARSLQNSLGYNNALELIEDNIESLQKALNTMVVHKTNETYLQSISAQIGFWSGVKKEVIPPSLNREFFESVDQTNY